MEREPNIGVTEALGEEGGNPPTPRSSGFQIEWRNKKYTVSSDELRIKAQFEQWVRSNALNGIEDIASISQPATAAKYRSAFLQDLAAKKYNWEGSNQSLAGEAIRNALQDQPGMQYFLYLLIVRCHPEVTEDMVLDMLREVPEQVTLAMAWAMGNWRSPGTTKASGTNGPAKTSKTKAPEPETMD